MDAQTALETSETADIDNYAKSILDALKGPEGILLDDSQVQALSIHWIDVADRGSETFEVSVASSPDDFLLKPINFFEMPDGLWYPFSSLIWNHGKPAVAPRVGTYAVLFGLEAMTSRKTKLRHLLRSQGFNRLRAYQETLWVSPIARGFHKTRIDDGFAFHALANWKAAYETWKAASPNDAQSVEKIYCIPS